VTAPDPTEFLAHLDDDEPAADRLLERLTEVRDVAFLGAGLTALARSEARQLPPAQRAQASSRQVRLGQLRDTNRGDLDGLRQWVRRAGEEVLLVRSLRTSAETAQRRVAATATGSDAASPAATSR
jgi:hypothetical protein